MRWSNNRTLAACSYSAVFWALFQTAQAYGAEVKTRELVDSSRAERVIEDYRQVSRWPTTTERKALQADKAATQSSIASFERLVGGVLRPEYVPDHWQNSVFGLKEWWDGDEDTLFAVYESGPHVFRLVETSTKLIITIVSDDMPPRIADWGSFLKDRCAKFLKGADRLLRYKTLYVTMVTASNTARMELHLPHLKWDEQRRAIWQSGHPTIWVAGNAVTFVVQKDLCGECWVGHSFGLRQRFPPLRPSLEALSSRELVRYATGETTEPERGVALSILLDRPDADAAVDSLILAYKQARTKRAKMAFVQTLERLAVEFAGPPAEKVKDFVNAELPREDHGRLRDLLSRARKTVKGVTERE